VLINFFLAFSWILDSEFFEFFFFFSGLGLYLLRFFMFFHQVKKQRIAFSAYIEMKMGMRCSLVKENKSIEQRLNLSRS